MNQQITVVALSLLALQACSSGSGSSDNQRLQEARFVDAEGSVLAVTTRYTAEGFVSGQVFVQDGEQVLSTSYELNEQGQFIRRSDDVDGDGIEDQSREYEYIDGLGRSRAYLFNGDGMVVGVKIFSFEGDLVTSADRRDIEAAATIDAVNIGSGSLLTRRFYTYEDGRVISTESDLDGNGSIDSIRAWTYNPDGTLASTTENSLAGGTIESGTYVYENARCTSAASNSADAHFCIR